MSKRNEEIMQEIMNILTERTADGGKALNEDFAEMVALEADPYEIAQIVPNAIDAVQTEVNFAFQELMKRYKKLLRRKNILQLPEGEQIAEDFNEIYEEILVMNKEFDIFVNKNLDKFRKSFFKHLRVIEEKKKDIYRGLGRGR